MWLLPSTSLRRLARPVLVSRLAASFHTYPSRTSERRQPGAAAYELVRDAQQPGLDADEPGLKSVAAREIAAGEVVLRTGGAVFAAPSMHSIMIDIDRHVEIQGDMRYTAHSFEPNCAMRSFDPDPNPVDLVAVRDIRKGEQLSFNYCTTEWDMGASFVDAETGLLVKGFHYLPEEEKSRLLGLGLLPEHILRLWMAERLGQPNLATHRFLHHIESVDPSAVQSNP